MRQQLAKPRFKTYQAHKHNWQKTTRQADGQTFYLHVCMEHDKPVVVAYDLNRKEQLRQIKFRVRDARGNLIGYNRFDQGRWSCQMLKAGGSGEWSNGVLHGPHMDQYTGLNDKNGAEVCEGDVVVEYLYREDQRPMKGRGVVKFDRGSFMLSGRYMPLRDADTERLEVIGNVYENRELLGPEAKQ